MPDEILQQLQQHADRISVEIAQKLSDARQHTNCSTALLTALERVDAAAKALVDAAHATGEGNTSHD